MRRRDIKLVVVAIGYCSMRMRKMPALTATADETVWNRRRLALHTILDNILVLLGGGTPVLRIKRAAACAWPERVSKVDEETGCVALAVPTLLLICAIRVGGGKGGGDEEGDVAGSSRERIVHIPIAMPSAMDAMACATCVAHQVVTPPPSVLDVDARATRVTPPPDTTTVAIDCADIGDTLAYRMEPAWGRTGSPGTMLSFARILARCIDDQVLAHNVMRDRKKWHKADAQVRAAECKRAAQKEACVVAEAMATAAAGVCAFMYM